MVEKLTWKIGEGGLRICDENEGIFQTMKKLSTQETRELQKLNLQEM
jgi:hypothetical protein